MSKKRSDIVLSMLQYFAGFCMFVMLVLTFIDVIGRYFLNLPVPAASEIIAFGMGLGAFAAFPLVTRDREHITVDIMDKFFKGNVRYVQRFVVLIGSLCYLAFITWVMFRQAQTFRRFNTLTDYLDIPKAYIVYVLSFFSALAVFLFLAVIWRYLREGGDPETKGKSQVPG